MSAPYDDGECVSCNRLSAEMAKLRAERDDLATQVELMRAAIGEAMGWNWLSDVESIPESVSTQLADALALPNTAAILHQRDARTLREAADIADQWGAARQDDHGGNALRNYASHIRAKAEELAPRTLRDMTEADFNEAHGC